MLEPKRCLQKETLTISFNNAVHLHLISSFHFVFDCFQCKCLIITYVIWGGSAVFTRSDICSCKKGFQRKTFKHFPCCFLFRCSPHSVVFSMSLFVSALSLCLSLSLSICHVHLLCYSIVFCPPEESIHATLDLNSDMQCPWAAGRDGYMNSI